MKAALERLQGALPDGRDLHIYGGLVLVGVFGGAPGWAAVGAALWYLGVFRLR